VRHTLRSLYRGASKARSSSRGCDQALDALELGIFEQALELDAGEARIVVFSELEFLHVLADVGPVALALVLRSRADLIQLGGQSARPS
jgi:hypothetical protein